MNNIIDILYERGFIENTTHDKELSRYLENENVNCYIGFDPTASSLHVGSLVPIMSLAYMQKLGYRPIALIGGGTGLVGDPSGKTETRQLLNAENLKENICGIKEQISRFIDFSEGKAILLNNADWLSQLGYISFLRDIGRHFSVNRMIKAESYKMRLKAEEGLNFIEFNYMLLQAYDFLKLFDKYGCRLQLGGSDQWGNIVAGIDLVRRMRHETTFGIILPLITNSNGEKMGKTAKGAVWLDSSRTTPYEFYQYWINTDDQDVARFMALYTFLPMNEIRATENFKEADLNSAKAVLAFEVTQLVHGREEAIKAYNASANFFGFSAVPEKILASSNIPRSISAIDDASVPHSDIDIKHLKEGIPAFKLFYAVGLADTSSASRRLIAQGGAYLNGESIKLFDYLITDSDVDNMEILLRAGKKRFHKLKVKNNN
ncbi:MAG: tyrosine--tRNA ligase [Desulfobacteraceae bacterium]|nr:tyrosine--tRNA ligase [Desulfobacteraceae bacterium]MBC2718759.1 tyrosine--tRNA ligase [Desulfobacteraceae bacterium]